MEYVFQPVKQVMPRQLEEAALLPAARSQYWPTHWSSPSSCHPALLGEHKVAFGFVCSSHNLFSTASGEKGHHKPPASQTCPTSCQKAANLEVFVSFWVWESIYTYTLSCESHFTSSCFQFSHAVISISYTWSFCSCDRGAICNPAHPFLHLDCYCNQFCPIFTLSKGTQHTHCKTLTFLKALLFQGCRKRYPPENWD